MFEVKVLSPRTESIASHTYHLIREKQGPWTHSPSQAAFLAERSGYGMTRENRQEGKKQVYHAPQVCISARKAKTNVNLD